MTRLLMKGNHRRTLPYGIVLHQKMADHTVAMSCFALVAQPLIY